jgi:hypothetical protein
MSANVLSMTEEKSAVAAKLDSLHDEMEAIRCARDAAVNDLMLLQQQQQQQQEEQQRGQNAIMDDPIAMHEEYNLLKQKMKQVANAITDAENSFELDEDAENALKVHLAHLGELKASADEIKYRYDTLFGTQDPNVASSTQRFYSQGSPPKLSMRSHRPFLKRAALQPIMGCASAKCLDYCVANVEYKPRAPFRDDESVQVAAGDESQNSMVDAIVADLSAFLNAA